MEHNDLVRLLTRDRLMLQAVIRSMVSDHHLAEDILQEVFVVALEKRAQFQKGSNFGAWEREIARRVALAQLRKARREPPLDPETMEILDPAFEAPAAVWTEKRDALRDCVGRLPEDSRRVLALRYVESVPLEQIGGLVSRSTDGVKALLKRLRHSLAMCMNARLGHGALSDEGGAL